jgi:hypothetical protein
MMESAVFSFGDCDNLKLVYEARRRGVLASFLCGANRPLQNFPELLMGRPTLEASGACSLFLGTLFSITFSFG